MISTFTIKIPFNPKLPIIPIVCFSLSLAIHLLEFILYFLHYYQPINLLDATIHSILLLYLIILLIEKYKMEEILSMFAKIATKE